MRRFREALDGALQMADVRQLMGSTDPADLASLTKGQYASYSTQREKTLAEARTYITDAVCPQLGLAAQEERLVLQLTQALIEIMDDQERR